MTRYPVLILAFNRPGLVQRLLDSLPTDLISEIFISIDGPRNAYDAQKIEEILEIVKKFETKTCIHLRVSSVNLGCRLGVIRGLDWYFQNINTAGVILEDDVLPESDFYKFVQVNSANVTSGSIPMLTGHNPFEKVEVNPYHSRFIFINGWCMSPITWAKLRENIFAKSFVSRTSPNQEKRSVSESVFWWATYARARIGIHDTWDSLFYRTFSANKLTCLIPQRNLVRNLGFGIDATHTTDTNGSILLDNGPDLSAGIKTNLELDNLLAKYYFKIKLRHAITPYFKVMRDLLIVRRIPNFEESLSFASEKRLSREEI